SDFQQFVDAAHQRGVAVMLDSVYGHTSEDFTYCDLYRRLKYQANPFLGAFAKDYFGQSTDFALQFTQDFFYTVNQFWLEHFHVDGFRYDCVPNYWDGPLGVGYANLVYSTYQMVKGLALPGTHWQRFAGANQLNLIQCAEQLEDPAGVLQQSYSNCTWQNGTLGAAQAVARGDFGAIYRLGLGLGLEGYPETATTGNDTFPRTALQYIENHDHERFVCNFGMERQSEGLLQNGNRDLWFKVQPYLIGLLTAKGIPMLWQGQEFTENYWVPPEGFGRVLLFRPVRWDYFYDTVGTATERLVRKLLRLRRQRDEFRRGQHFFYNDWDRYQSRGLLLFSRASGNQFSVVALNFSDSDQTVPFYFPLAGTYAEQLHGNAADLLQNVPALAETALTIPSHYGRVWSKV
ncbi:MAG TPA: alpha-amylase family glycosyl hydrolase, partial [Verrucomicrobiae bacterium]